MPKKDLLFITVIGKDTKGIVATISQVLFRQNINIEDINQQVLEGFFVMTMLVDMKGARAPLEKVRAMLEKVGRTMKLKIQLQHSSLFTAMHRV